MKGAEYRGDLNGDGTIKLRISRVLVYGVYSSCLGWGSASDILEYGTESTYSTKSAYFLWHGIEYWLPMKESSAQNPLYEHEGSDPIIMKTASSLEKSENDYPALKFHLSIKGSSNAPQLELQHSSKIMFILNYVKCYFRLRNTKTVERFS